MPWVLMRFICRLKISLKCHPKRCWREQIPFLYLLSIMCRRCFEVPIGKRPYFIYSTADEMRGSRYCSARTERLASLSRYCLTYALD